MFKIEKNVPVPEKPSPIGKYPFAEMNVGDSFLVPGAQARRLQSAIQVFRRRVGKDKKFIARDVEGGARCWRIR